MNSRKPKHNNEHPVDLPQERLQWVVPDRKPKAPTPPGWKPSSDITVEIRRDIRSRLH